MFKKKLNIKKNHQRYEIFFFNYIKIKKRIYIYIKSKNFEKILKQKNDKIFEKLSILKTILLYSRKFVNNNTK